MHAALPTTAHPNRWAHCSARNVGIGALGALAAAHWLLIALTRLHQFQLWLLVSPLLVLTVAGALWAFWQQQWRDRAIVVGLCALGLWLYTPPAEELALSGDAAIYLNEGAFVARTGGDSTQFAPLASLSPATRTLFYLTSREQLPAHPIQSYDGLLFRGYYVQDAATATIQLSRMPLSTVWLALAHILGGLPLALASTPGFAILGLLLLYATARQLYAWPVALWTTLLLAVSYTQIHFGRAAYAEIYGQLWTVAGILTALYWIQERAPHWLLLTGLFWVTTWAGRIDALLLLGSFGLLLIYAAVERDRRSLRWVLLSLPCYGGLIWLGTNGGYVGATYEFLQIRWPWFGGALMALAVALPLAVAVAWLWGRAIQRLLQHVAPLLHGLLLLLTAFVILWATLPNPLREPTVTRNFQEIIWFSSDYLSPLLYWLVLLGIGRLLLGGYTARTFWLLATFYSLGTIFFYSYTSANVYPVSLRRLISDVLPLMVLLAGQVLAKPWSIPGWRWWRWMIAIGPLLWMLWLSWPLLQIEEGAGTAAFLAEVHATLPTDAILIFEDQDDNSWVGWLAAPLYSFYGRWTLLLDGEIPDPTLWPIAVEALAATGRPIYLITQQDPLPAPLLPPGHRATLTTQMEWRSTMIGQTRKPYPPPVWNFAHPLYIYALEAENE